MRSPNGFGPGHPTPCIRHGDAIGTRTEDLGQRRHKRSGSEVGSNEGSTSKWAATARARHPAGTFTRVFYTHTLSGCGRVRSANREPSASQSSTASCPHVLLPCSHVAKKWHGILLELPGLGPCGVEAAFQSRLFDAMRHACTTAGQLNIANE